MFKIGALISDPYNRKARLQPALFIALPALVTAFLLFPQFQSRWPGFLALFVTCGGLGWLMQAGRQRGKKMEPKLFGQWGGKPSVVMLRYRDQRLGTSLKDRYRRFLAANVPGIAFPSASDEAHDPEAADALYEAANAWLLVQTRDREAFRLVFEENVNYGFRRNLWALRPFGFVLDGTCLLFLGYLSGRAWNGRFDSLSIETLTAAAVVFAHGLALASASKGWVRAAAEAYAGQLLAACDTLSTRSGTVKPPRRRRS
jgi:hypothetical protein